MMSNSDTDAAARTNVQKRLAELEREPSIDAALAFYDSLPAVETRALLGAWRGSELSTGNPIDGLLGAFGWHGKRFDDEDSVHPLVFEAGGGGVLSVNPTLVPLSLALRFPAAVRTSLARALFRTIRPMLRTNRPKARLRMTKYRGVVSATMTYDTLPIRDVFRGIDADTVLGAMDMRELEAPFMFTLRRERGAV